MKEHADIGAWSRTTADEQEIPLAGERAEFRTALREEIWASRASSAGAGIPLINGRKVSEVGGAFQYAFSIQNALNAPGDQPADTAGSQGSSQSWATGNRRQAAIRVHCRARLSGKNSNESRRLNV